MLGTTVIIPSILVPLMGGGDVQKAEVINTVLFVSGINTLLQSLFGSRLPVVIGASYAYVIPALYITFSYRFTYYLHPHVVSYPSLSCSSRDSHRNWPRRACVSSACEMCRDWTPSVDHTHNLISEILTAAGAYNKRPDSTQLSCRTDRSGLISASPWVKIPYPLQWGRPSFHASDAFAMIAASYVAIVEVLINIPAHILGLQTDDLAERLGATHIPPSVLSRGIGWQGVGVLLNGLFGTATGSTALVAAWTNKGWEQKSGKFGAVLASIPLPIFAALYCVLFAYVGLGLLQFCNLNSFRTKFILGFSIFIGLSVAQYFTEYLFISGRGPVHTRTSAFNVIMQVIFSSAATVGIMAAFLLDCTHSYGHPSVRRDSGRHWWEKFRVYYTDTRTEEFYALPYNLNRFFPSF
ncbi:hypothetical protein YC2023_043666 [Brassica napus]